MGKVSVVPGNSLGLSGITIPSTISSAPLPALVDDPAFWGLTEFDSLKEPFEVDGVKLIALLDPFRLAPGIGQQIILADRTQDLSLQVDEVVIGYVQKSFIGTNIPNFSYGSSDVYVDTETQTLISYSLYDGGEFSAIIVEDLFDDLTLPTILRDKVSWEVFSSELKVLFPENVGLEDEKIIIIDQGAGTTDLSNYDLVPSSAVDPEIEVIPQRTSAGALFDFIGLSKTLIGSDLVETFQSDPGPTSYRSSGNSDGTKDSLFYASSPSGIEVDFSTGIVAEDGWGYQDRFDINRFDISGSLFDDKFFGIRNDFIVDLGGDDSYTLVGDKASNTLILDAYGNSMIDASGHDGAALIYVGASGVWSAGAYALQEAFGDGVATGRLLSLDGYMKTGLVFTGRSKNEDGEVSDLFSDFRTGNTTVSEFNSRIDAQDYIAIKLYNSRESFFADKTSFFLDDAVSWLELQSILPSEQSSVPNRQRFDDLELLIGSAAMDLIDLTSSDFSLAGQEMIIMAHEGNDVIWGSDADEIIYGGAGDDVISGGLGNDILIGNTGNDVFEFTQSSGSDIIGALGVDDVLRFFYRPTDPTNFLYDEGVITWGDVTITLTEWTPVGTEADLNVEFVLI